MTHYFTVSADVTPEWTTIGEFNMHPEKGTRISPRVLTLGVLNLFNQALGDFEVEAKVHPDHDYVSLISGSTWETLAGFLKQKSANLNSLSALTNATATLEIGPAAALRFRAKSGGTEVLSNGTFTGNANDWTLGTGVAYGTNNVAVTASSSTMNQALADMGSAWVDEGIYWLAFTVSGYSAGDFNVGTNSAPYQSDDAIAADGTYLIQVTADDHADGIVFTFNNFTGVIDSVSLKRGAYVAVLGAVA